METPKDIELRSERIKNIIGQIPSFLIRCGNGLLCVIFVLLIGVAVYLPFPYKVNTTIYFEISEIKSTSSSVKLYVPSKITNQVPEAKSLHFTLSAYPNEIFIPTRIDSISSGKKIIGQTLFQQIFVGMDNTSFEDKEEIKNIHTPLKGSMILSFPPRTFAERFYGKDE